MDTASLFDADKTLMLFAEINCTILILEAIRTKRVIKARIIYTKRVDSVVHAPKIFTGFNVKTVTWLYEEE